MLLLSGSSRPAKCDLIRVPRYCRGLLIGAAFRRLRARPSCSSQYILMSTDGNADGVTAASPRRGFCATSHDIFCIRCGVSVYRSDMKDIGRHLATHCREHDMCRVSGNLAQLGNSLQLDMISKNDQYQRERKDGCSWFKQEDPTDTYKCPTCTKLFGSEAGASSHYKRSQCKSGPPPISVDCHETISGVLVEVVPRRMKRKLDDAFAVVAASPNISNGSTGKCFMSVWHAL